MAVGEVEPLRIPGDATVLVALGLSWAALRARGGPKAAAVVCGLAAVVVVGLNLARVGIEEALPVPAAVFIAVSVGLVLRAAWCFRSATDGAFDPERVAVAPKRISTTTPDA